MRLDKSGTEERRSKLCNIGGKGLPQPKQARRGRTPLSVRTEERPVLQGNGCVGGSELDMYRPKREHREGDGSYPRENEQASMQKSFR